MHLCLKYIVLKNRGEKVFSHYSQLLFKSCNPKLKSDLPIWKPHLSPRPSSPCYCSALAGPGKMPLGAWPLPVPSHPWPAAISEPLHVMSLVCTLFLHRVLLVPCFLRALLQRRLREHFPGPSLKQLSPSCTFLSFA